MWMYMGNLSLRTFFNIFFFIRKFSNFRICLNLVGFNMINSIEFLLNVQNQLTNGHLLGMERAGTPYTPKLEINLKKIKRVQRLNSRPGVAWCVLGACV